MRGLILAAMAGLMAQASSALAAEPCTAPDAGAAETLDALFRAAARADGPAYFALFTPDARFVGTDPHEDWDMTAFHAFADPRFAKGRGWTFTPVARRIAFTGEGCGRYAIFFERLDNAGYGDTRGSGVLVRTPAGWRVREYVLSFAVPNARAEAVVSAIRAKP